MLLLIALANVGAWASFTDTWLDTTSIDYFLTILRLGFVDQRSYPLFAMLFGFGLMIMVQRQRAHALKKARVQSDPMSRRSAEARARASANEKARTLLRRRGWWMLPFGFAHGLIFPGDVIGSYAIVALIFAGLLVAGKQRTMIVLGLIPTTLGVIGETVDGLIPAGESEQLLLTGYTLLSPLSHFQTWVTITLSSLAFSNIILAAALGAYLATTDVMMHPERHREFLAASAVAGLAIGFFSGLPAGLVEIEIIADDEIWWWIYSVAGLGGIPAAWGWLSVLALFTGPAPEDGKLRGVRWVLSAVGRRSMTAYLSQTIFFFLVFSVLAAAELPVSETTNVIAACVAWTVIAAGCVALEMAGKRGPFEVLLRRAVSSAQRPEPRPLIADVAFVSVG